MKRERRRIAISIWNRDKAPVDRIVSHHLAEFGRWEFLKEESGINPLESLGMVAALNGLIYSRSPTDRAVIVAELHRHAEKGEWEKVGAWKYIRNFMDEDQDTVPLIDAGLLAIHRMRVTNLGVHLAPIDSPRYEQLTGGPVPNDGFFGPPVFDSKYGPNRQYYFDNAIAVAAARRPVRVPSAPGIEPGSLDDAARAMWDFGMLVHRGPRVVPPDIASEPNVVRAAIEAASNVDHARFAELVAAKVMDRTVYLYSVWSTLGGARFIEEYLDRSAIGTPAYAKLLDEGLKLVINGGMLDVAFPIDVLTSRARNRLMELKLRLGD